MKPVKPSEPNHSRFLSGTWRASAWILIGHSVSHVLRLGSNLMLVRLFLPEAFGLMALMNALLQGVQMLSDIGIVHKVVQSHHGEDDHFLNTAWTAHLIRGFLLWGFYAASAWPFSTLYAEPRLVTWMPVLGLSLIFSGFASMSLFTARRRLEVGRVTLLHLASQFLSLAFILILSLVTRSLWALVLGVVVSSFLIMVGSYWILEPRRHRLVWNQKASEEIFDFGRWIFISTALTFLAAQAHRLILGKMASMELLGIYTIAFSLAVIPYELGCKLSEFILYPYYSHHARQSPDTLLKKIMQSRRLLTSVMLTASLAVAIGSPIFFHWLYPSAYENAGWMTQFLAFWVWFSMLQMVSDRILLTLGQSQHLAWANGIKLAVTTASLLIGYHWAGMPGFLTGMAIGALAGYLWIARCLKKHALEILRSDFFYTGILITLFYLNETLIRWIPFAAPYTREATSAMVLFPLFLWNLKLLAEFFFKKTLAIQKEHPVVAPDKAKTGSRTCPVTFPAPSSRINFDSGMIPLGIVVVNFHQADLTIACLESLATQVTALPGTRVTVVDNHSGDDSVGKLSAAIYGRGWQDWASLKISTHNGGFAFGMNLGLKALPAARYVLFLNSDTYVQPGCLAHCYQKMEETPSIGILGCREINRHGQTLTVARKFPTLFRMFCSTLGLPWYWPTLFRDADIQDPDWDRNTTSRDVDWLSGAFLFARGRMLEKIGGFDEDFFFYGEDVEFCHRAWRAGYRCYYDARAAIMHEGGGSSSVVDTRKLYWNSRYLIQKKCYGIAARWALRFLDLIVYTIRFLILFFMRRSCAIRFREKRDILKIIVKKIKPAGVA